MFIYFLRAIGGGFLFRTAFERLSGRFAKLPRTCVSSALLFSRLNCVVIVNIFFSRKYLLCC